MQRRDFLKTVGGTAIATSLAGCGGKEAPIEVLSHGMYGNSVEGQLRNNGDAAYTVMVDAYFYDGGRQVGNGMDIIRGLRPGMTANFNASCLFCSDYISEYEVEVDWHESF